MKGTEQLRATDYAEDLRISVAACGDGEYIRKLSDTYSLKMSVPREKAAEAPSVKTADVFDALKGLMRG